MRGSFIFRVNYDAEQEQPHTVRVIVNGYEVNAVKADSREGWADLEMLDNGEIIRVKGAVEFLPGAPRTAPNFCIAAMEFLARGGPEPDQDPRKFPRWGSFVKY